MIISNCKILNSLIGGILVCSLIVTSGCKSGGDVIRDALGLNTEIDEDNYDIWIANSLVVSRITESAKELGLILQENIDNLICDEGSFVEIITLLDGIHVSFSNCLLVSSSSTVLLDGNIAAINSTNSTTDFLFGNEADGPRLSVITSTDIENQYDGSINYAETVTSESLSGDKIKISTNRSTNNSTHTLSFYNTRIEDETSSTLTAIHMNGRMDSSLMAPLDYNTRNDFKRLDGRYPHEGEFIITSLDDRSSASIVANSDAETVHISLDVDGNGLADQSFETSWAALAILVDPSLGGENGFNLLWKNNP